MNGLSIAPDQPKELTNIDQLTAEIVLLKQQTAMNIIEIGRRLLQAKEQLPHGQWGTWLQDKIEFSHQTANRFMQVATEFANSSALRNLNPTKIYSMLELPAEQREEFLKAEHLLPSGDVKKVDDMTTRELQQAIKEKTALQSQLEAAQNSVKTVVGERNQLRSDNSKLQKSAKQLETELQALKDDMKQPVTLEAAVIEKVPAAVEQELSELRAKAAQQPNEALTRYRVQFEALAAQFNALLSTLESIQSVDADTHTKYKRATLALLGKMEESLNR